MTAVAERVPGLRLKITPRSGNTSPIETPCSSRIETVLRSAISSCEARSDTATGATSLMRIDATVSPSSVTSTRSNGSIFQKKPAVPSSRVKASPLPQAASSSPRVVRPGCAPRKLAGSMESVGVSSGADGIGAAMEPFFVSVAEEPAAAATAAGAGSAACGRTAGSSAGFASAAGGAVPVATSPASSVAPRRRTLDSGPRFRCGGTGSIPSASPSSGFAAGDSPGRSDVQPLVSVARRSKTGVARDRKSARPGMPAADSAGVDAISSGSPPCSSAAALFRPSASAAGGGRTGVDGAWGGCEAAVDRDAAAVSAAPAVAGWRACLPSAVFPLSDSIHRGSRMSGREAAGREASPAWADGGEPKTAPTIRSRLGVSEYQHRCMAT